MPQQHAFYLHRHLHPTLPVRRPERLSLSLPITTPGLHRSRELAGLAPEIPVFLVTENREHSHLIRMASHWFTVKALNRLKQAFVLTDITGCMILADGA